MDNVIKVSIAGDEGYDKKLIITRFMKELCRRDREVNEGKVQSNSNRFSIREIWQESLSNSYTGEGGLEEVRKYVRLHSMDKDPEVDIDVPHDMVSLTNKGRTKCTEPDL